MRHVASITGGAVEPTRAYHDRDVAVVVVFPAILA